MLGMTCNPTVVVGHDMIAGILKLSRCKFTWTRTTQNNIFSALKEHLQQPKHGGVRGIHDLHIWTLNGTEHCMSVHVVTAPVQEGGNMQLAMSATRYLLRKKFGITHSTVQVEQGGQTIDASGCLDHEWQCQEQKH